MSQLALRAESLGKRYRLGELEPYKTVRESITRGVKAPFRLVRRRRPAAGPDETIWALREVSFEMREGEVLGVIGRNGAGKTTLLKVLSQITEPTEGRAELFGSAGSLLEVGTGFHLELTGRENIFLNGAILGMGRRETQTKFDEIVAFAELERFIDTPVKRYSTGMSVRLAFAVAAHMEPEILLVDEVLAVGDADFQKKCLGKLEDVGREGRTVIFVSHNMPMVLRLCPRALLLDAGRLVADGAGRDVVRRYLESGLGVSAAREWASPGEAPGDDAVRLRAVRVLSNGQVSEEVDITQPIEVEVEYWDLGGQPHLRPGVVLAFQNEDNVLLFVSSNLTERSWHARSRESGVVRSVCRIPPNYLAEGEIFVHTALNSIKPLTEHIMERDSVAFHVVDRSWGDGVRADYGNPWPGVVRPMLEWTTDHVLGAETQRATAHPGSPPDKR